MEALLKRLLVWLSIYFNWEQKAEEDSIPNQDPQPAPTPALPITPSPKPTMPNAERLYQTALASLHKDMSPNNLAPNTLACMESVDGVWLAAFGEHLLSMPARLSTEAGYEAMLKDPRLKKVDVPTRGCIVISPTGFSNKGSQHGHTGLWGNSDVMSNDSNTGLWSDNYTHQAWYNVFNKTLGFPVYFFEPV